MVTKPDTRSGLKKAVMGIRAALRPVHKSWMILVGLLSWLLARVVAAVLFFVGFIPYGLAMRVLGVDPLARNLTTDEDSYWDEPEASNRDIDEFKKQF